MNDFIQDVEASQKSLQEATHQLTDLENRNEQLVMEIRHLEQSKEIQLQVCVQYQGWSSVRTGLMWRTIVGNN